MEAVSYTHLDVYKRQAFGCNTTLPWGMFSETTRAYLMGSTVTAQSLSLIHI